MTKHEHTLGIGKLFLEFLDKKGLRNVGINYRENIPSLLVRYGSDYSGDTGKQKLLDDFIAEIKTK